MGRRFLTLLAVLFALSLLAAACGGDEAEEVDQPEPVAAVGVDDSVHDESGMIMEHLGDGSLGAVRVEPGGAIQIRSLEAITGDVAFLDG